MICLFNIFKKGLAIEYLGPIYFKMKICLMLEAMIDGLSKV
jgi:hypothetical protein